MKCDSYIKNISNYKCVDSLTIDEKKHYLQCDTCRKKTDSYFLLFKIIEEEKSVTVNPFISTNIITKIEKNTKSVGIIRIALNYVGVIIFSIFIGGLGALFFANNNSLLTDNEILFEYFGNDIDDFYVENSWLNMNFYNLDN